jgi:hypothetical protein
MIRNLLLCLLAFVVASPAQAAKGDTPLFSSSDVIHITIAGPLSEIAKSRSEVPVPGTLAVAGSQPLPITLAARGITRKASDVCQFPPLKIGFSGSPPQQSIFAGQKSLKLVAYCRNSQSFQQYVLLEYAAYRMFNLLSPASFRVRLASIDYVDDSGRPLATSRYGFFIEDLDDVAARNGMREAKLPELIPLGSLSPRHAALYALFQHMVANHDWSMRAGPKGESCCHNAKMIAPARGAASGVIPIPYDFDFSGFVNAPYASPPDALRISSVKQRQYRGYCAHNAAVIAAAAQFRAQRPAMLAALAATPGLDPKTAARATEFLAPFFADIASDDSVRAKVLKSCV